MRHNGWTVKVEDCEFTARLLNWHCWLFADLRIENGIDPTCKEEYLTEEDFSAVILLFWYHLMSGLNTQHDFAAQCALKWALLSH